MTTNSTEIKLVGAFFLVGGLTGFIYFLAAVFPINGLISFLYIIPTFLYGLTFYSGYLLLIKNDISGMEIGRAIIALQIIHFAIAGVEYVFVTGAHISIGFINWHFVFNFGLDNKFLISLYDESSNFLFKVNLLALAIFIYLSRTLTKLDEDHN